MLLKSNKVKKCKARKDEVASNQGLTVYQTVRLGLLGLALSVSPVWIESTIAETKSPLDGLPDVKAPNPADPAPDPERDPLNKEAAARRPNGKVTVNSIEATLEATYRNNTDLKDFQANSRSKDEGVPVALAGWRPTLTASAGISGTKNIFSGTVKDGNNNTTTPSTGTTNSVGQASLQLRQNIFQGGATVAATCQAESNVQVARAQLADKERDVLYKAVQAYLNVMAKSAELEYRKSNEKALKGTLDATQSKYDVGEETLTAIAQARASLADGTAQREAAHASLLAAEATFEQVTGVLPGKLSKPSEPPLLPNSLKEAIEIARKNNPGVIVAMHQEKADRSAIKVSDAELLPRVELEGRINRSVTNTRPYYSTSNISSAKTNDLATAQQVSLNLTMPIYEAGAIRGKSRGLREVAEQRRIQIETARQQVTQQLIEAWELYLASKANVESYKIQVQSNETALEGTRQEMLVGSKILLDVLNAQQVLVNSQLNLVRAQQNYYQAYYAVLALMGRLNVLALKLKVKRYDPRVHYNDVRNSW